MPLGVLLGVAFALILGMMVGLTIVIMVGIGGFLWDQHPWLLGSVVIAGGLASAIVLKRARRSRRAVVPGGQAVHPGITMHSIPVAGGMGLVFTMGYVAMFWFGLPGVRAVVLGLAGIGALLGAVLVLLHERRAETERDTKVLHLERDKEPS